MFGCVICGLKHLISISTEMRYSVNILCWSLFLVGDLTKSLEDENWIKMPKLSLYYAELMYNDNKIKGEEFLFKHMDKIQYNSLLTPENYLEMCDIITAAIVVREIRYNQGAIMKADMANRYCNNMNDAFVISQPNEIKFNMSKFSEYNVPPLRLLNCHCKYIGSYMHELKFRLGEVILDNPKAGMQRYFLQFDPYYQPADEMTIHYKLENAWLVLNRTVNLN